MPVLAVTVPLPVAECAAWYLRLRDPATVQREGLALVAKAGMGLESSPLVGQLLGGLSMCLTACLPGLGLMAWEELPAETARAARNYWHALVGEPVEADDHDLVLAQSAALAVLKQVTGGP